MIEPYEITELSLVPANAYNVLAVLEGGDLSDGANSDMWKLQLQTDVQLRD